MTVEDLQAENAALRLELAQAKQELNEMKADVKTTVGTFLELTNQLGIDFTKVEDLKPAKLLPKITIKVMGGGLKLDSLNNIAPFYNKYKDLIEK